MVGLTLSWAFPGTGSSRCTIDDGAAREVIPASYLSDAPNDLLHAVTRIVTGFKEVNVGFAGEPGGHRWSFHRYGGFVDIEIAWIPDKRGPGDGGRRLVWSTHRQPVADLAQACIDCFTAVREVLGEERYERDWGFPLPWAEPRALDQRVEWPGGRQPYEHELMPRVEPKPMARMSGTRDERSHFTWPMKVKASEGGQ